MKRTIVLAMVAVAIVGLTACTPTAKKPIHGSHLWQRKTPWKIEKANLAKEVSSKFGQPVLIRPKGLEPGTGCCSAVIDGDLAVVSAQNDSAWVFTHQNGHWVETAQLIINGLDTSAVCYGAETEIARVAGKTFIFVGAPHENEKAGAIYVFTQTVAGGWEFFQKLVNKKNTRYGIGNWMEVDNNRLVTTSGTKVHVFRIEAEAIVLEQEVAIDAMPDIKGDTLVGGMGFDDLKGMRIAKRRGTNWVIVKDVDLPKYAKNFGEKSAICDSYIAVGGSNVVWIHEDNNTYPLVNMDSLVTLEDSGDNLIVGAYNADGYKGELWFFERKNGDWQKSRLPLPSDTPPGEHWGWTIDSDSKSIITTSPGNFDKKSYIQGRVAIYTLP